MYNRICLLCRFPIEPGEESPFSREPVHFECEVTLHSETSQVLGEWGKWPYEDIDADEIEEAFWEWYWNLMINC